MIVIINRHNYEEYFLLYLDDELKPGERSAVEVFLQQNPDLAAEMEMLLQTILPGEAVPFEQKELLFNPAEGITLYNYEEFFLLSVDKELTEKESNEVEKFVLKHPELQNEFVLLQKTKLDLEEIRFKDKNKLYRQAAPERAIIMSPWFRISVAAAVLGLLVTTGVFNNKQEQNVRPVVRTQVSKEIKAIPVKPEREVTAPVRNLAVALAPNPSNKEVKYLSKVAKKGRETGSRKDVAPSPVKKMTTPEMITGSNNTIAEETAQIQSSNSAEQVLAATSANKNNLPVVGEVQRNTTTSETRADDASPSLAKHVVYRELDSRDDDEEKSYYIGSAEINKNKLKGLFKKAAGFFSKKSNPDNEERSLKIAGFEIRSN